MPALVAVRGRCLILCHLTQVGVGSNPLCYVWTAVVMGVYKPLSPSLGVIDRSGVTGGHMIGGGTMTGVSWSAVTFSRIYCTVFVA